MAFDIRKLDTKAASEKGLTFDVMWDGQPIGVKISVVGAESATFKKHKAAVDGKIENAKKRGKELSSEDKDKLYSQLAAHCTTGWIGMELDGKELEFSSENAFAVYTEFPVIGTQVIAQIYNLVEMVGNVEIGES